MRCAELYFVRGAITPGEMDLLGRFLFCDPVVETVELEGETPAGRSRRIEVAFRPGVTDPVAEGILRAARELGVTGIEAAATGRSLDIGGTGCRTTTFAWSRRDCSPMRSYSVGRSVRSDPRSPNRRPPKSCPSPSTP
ncbi:MAG: hypothetical protein NT080_04915 [Spirochaetes bacterium]|nr:hypothetical protein [Spirochaetota bacterium]